MKEQYKLFVVSIDRSGPDGDRATRNTDYRDYKVVLQRVWEDAKDEVELAYINGYDHFWSHVRSKDEVMEELAAAVTKFEKFFGVKAQGVNLVRKVTTVVTEEWIEE